MRGPFRLNNASTARAEGDFEIAATNDGGFILVFGVSAPADDVMSRIRWERHDADGDMIDHAVVVTDNTQLGSVIDPDVVGDLSDNSAVVSYTDVSNGGDININAKTVSASGRSAPSSPPPATLATRRARAISRC